MTYRLTVKGISVIGERIPIGVAMTSIGRMLS